MITETEAKKKWCPFSRVSAAASGEKSGEWYNRAWSMLTRIFGEKKEHECAFNCIASECMAWRIGEPERVELETMTLPAGQKPDDYMERQIEQDKNGLAPRWLSENTATSGVKRWRLIEYQQHKGFCGLAGKEQ